MLENNINITFPDGKVRPYPVGITGMQIAQSISNSLAKNVLAIKLNEQQVTELNQPIHQDATIQLLTFDDKDGQNTFWHSSAHLLAEALQALYPNTKFTIGPPIENGFYYDVELPENTKVSSENFATIEQKMLELAKQKSQFVRQNVSQKDALEYYKNNPYKTELIENLTDGEITFYTQGSFTDLCRGPHIPDTSYIKAVKIMNIAGAYWRGNEKNKQLTRFYAVSFPKQTQLDEHLTLLEEAQKRDHRKLGKELELYLITQKIGGGLPVWLPNGTTLRRTLENFLRKEQVKRGYQEVITPHIGNLELYKTSGHYPFYADSQFAPIKVDDEEYLLKPMNCPHHHQIYDSKPRSYRDLPVRLAEFGTVYRYEQSGELNGLSRVRGFTQDDAHIYCTDSQLRHEIKEVISLTQYVFSTFGMEVSTRLSFRDDNNPDKYGGDLALWERAQAEIKTVADELNLNYFIGIGEAAFYGPKIDFTVKDALGRKWQLGTVQVDYVMPERFDLEYTAADGSKQRPVIIHRAPFGSMERFTSILIEHFAGKFPTWLSPQQVAVLPVSEKFGDYAQEVANYLKNNEIRAEADHRNEKIGKKIRDAETAKTPYMLVVGEKEATDNSVAVRRQSEGDKGTMPLTQFLQHIQTEINNLK